MMDKLIGADEETVIEVDEENAELQIELDDLDVVAGGAKPARCPKCYFYFDTKVKR